MAKIVVFDTETTGLDPVNNDIIQVAAMVLKQNFSPDKSIPPFYMLIKPRHYPYDGTKEQIEKYLDDIRPAMRVNKISMEKLMLAGFDPLKASQLFEEWWTHIGAQQVEPLCQNYPFDSSFWREWLGPISYSHYFSRYYRDTYVAARFIQDSCEYLGGKTPFPDGFSLTKLAVALKVEHSRVHDAFSDCIITAECYKRMCIYMPVGAKHVENIIQ